jgi:hypothetical protein
MIHVNCDPEKQTAIDWMAANDFEATEWGWDDGGIFDVYKIYNGGFDFLPQMVIIDKDGNVRYSQLDWITPPFLISLIEELI